MDADLDHHFAAELHADMRWLSALARRLVRDTALADDAVQEAWVAAQRRLAARGDGRRPDRGLLGRTLRGVVMQARRAAGRRRFHEQQAAQLRSAAHTLPSTQELLVIAERQRELSRHLSDLDEPFRTTLLLHFQQGVSTAALAQRFGIRENSVRWRLRRGLEILRDALQREDGGPGLLGLVPLAALTTPPVGASTAASMGGGFAHTATGPATRFTQLAVPWMKKNVLIAATATAATLSVALLGALGFLTGNVDSTPPDAKGMAAVSALHPSAPASIATPDRTEPDPTASGPGSPRELRVVFRDDAGVPIPDATCLLALMRAQRPWETIAKAATDAAGLAAFQDFEYREPGIAVVVHHADFMLAEQILVEGDHDIHLSAAPRRELFGRILGIPDWARKDLRVMVAATRPQTRAMGLIRKEFGDDLGFAVLHEVGRDGRFRRFLGFPPPFGVTGVGYCDDVGEPVVRAKAKFEGWPPGNFAELTFEAREFGERASSFAISVDGDFEDWQPEGLDIYGPLRFEQTRQVPKRSWNGTWLERTKSHVTAAWPWLPHGEYQVVVGTNVGGGGIPIGPVEFSGDDLAIHMPPTSPVHCVVDGRDPKHDYSVVITRADRLVNSQCAALLEHGDLELPAGTYMAWARCATGGVTQQSAPARFEHDGLSPTTLSLSIQEAFRVTVRVDRSRLGLPDRGAVQWTIESARHGHFRPRSWSRGSKYFWRLPAGDYVAGAVFPDGSQVSANFSVESGPSGEVIVDLQ